MVGGVNCGLAGKDESYRLGTTKKFKSLCTHIQYIHAYRRVIHMHTHTHTHTHTKRVHENNALLRP